MKQVIIKNLIINSAFSEPKRHFRFDEEGITGDIKESRRISHYFIPIAKPKKKGKTAQLELDLGGEWTQDRVEENKFIALKTVIYITEVAKKYGDVWMENNLRRFNEDNHYGDEVLKVYEVK